MIRESTTVDAYEVSDGTATVELRKLVTPNGERLVVASDGASTRLDALALESLTWQDDEFFGELGGTSHVGTERPEDDAEPVMQISNEYTTVRIRSHDTADGSRISVRSPKLEYWCLLSPAELAAIADKPISFFSELLETPLGPEPDHSHII